MSVEAGLAPSLPRQDLKRRLVTAIVLGPVFLLAVAVGGLVFLGAMMLLAGVAAWEFFRMAGRKSGRPRAAPGIGLALAFPALLYWSPSHPLAIPALVTVGVLGIALAQLLDPDGEEMLAAVSTTVYGSAYAGLLLAHFVLIREVSRVVPGMPYWSGALLVGVTVALTWVNDSSAYVIGRRWGRRKLIARVSPGKTVEGAVGALLVTVLAAVPTLWLVDRWVPLFDLRDALAVGTLVGVAAPLGDLVESAFKRDAGVKDASDLVPGHGGVLDRFDSLMAVAPAFWYYLWAVVL
ncbi:MAG TPA: phosphatidate cytidylyltransferase [Gemmatimonadota bacterium]|nr:phosphatidate cytidylyltransferase [Gemmatimonadota bacterium]